MTALLTQRITVPPDRRVQFVLPDEVFPGEADVRMEITNANPPARPRNTHLWAGKLAHCPALAGNPVDIQRRLRDEWK